MFGLKYTSDENIVLLEKLQARLNGTTDPRTINETELEIEKIKNSSKPYTECNLDESNELKNQLYSRMNILMGLGKLNSASVFNTHLKDVDFHIQMLRMKELEEIKNRPVKPEVGPSLKNPPPSLNSLKRERERVAFGERAKWTTNDYDDEVGDEEIEDDAE